MLANGDVGRGIVVGSDMAGGGGVFALRNITAAFFRSRESVFRA
jgi:hypothetical protein